MRFGKFLLAAILMYTSCSFGQTIPTSYKVDWTNSGLYEEVNFTNSVNIKSFGASGNGKNDDSEFFNKALSSLNSEPGIIYFPPGNYLFKSQIKIPSNIIIRGASSDSTFIYFDLGGLPIHCFDISSSQENIFIKIPEVLISGKRKIRLDNSQNFADGDFIQIRIKNGEWDTKPANWAKYCVGHITKVDKISGNDLHLNDPIRFDGDKSLNPEIRVIEPIKNVGLEYFTISRIDLPSSGGPYNIHFSFASNSWVKGVESSKSVGSHLLMESCYGMEVSGNYFHSAFEYNGSGTRGYGVTLIKHTCNSIIENNIFKELRHSMMVKEGANGNVFAYNYSFEPKRDEFPSDAGGDISCHGHYPFANLFEGNVVQTIHIDQAWGPNGPKNTFFRNRAELYGVIVSSGSYESDRQVFIGNEVTNKNFLKGNFIINADNHFQHGNFVKENVVPSETGFLSVNSLYLQKKPFFWKNKLDWPSIGLSSKKEVDLPAYNRVKNEEKFTIGPEKSTSGKVIYNQNKSLKIDHLDLSFHDEIKISISSTRQQKVNVELYSLGGQEIFKRKVSLESGINNMIISDKINQLLPTWYFLLISGEKEVIKERVLKVR